MSQSLPYDEGEVIKTIREVLEYNPYIAPELIALEVALRGYVVDPLWLDEQIERSRQREEGERGN